MKPEQQVCTLQQAKRLKELGLTQQSIFCFIGDENPDPKYNTPMQLYYSENARTDIGKSWYDNRIAAFNVAELGELLKEHPDGSYYSDHLGDWLWQILSFDVDSDEYPAGFKVTHSSDGEFETEAEARADQLLFMIENKLVDIDYLNEIMLDDEVTEPQPKQPS